MPSSTHIPFPLLPPWLRWAGVVAIAGVIFYASILTVPPGTPLETVKPELIPLDKWYHFLGYAAFGGSLAYATTDWETDRAVLLVAVFALTVVYGVGLELVQSQLPARHFSVADAYANAFGALFVLPWYALRPRLRLVPIRDMLSD